MYKLISRVRNITISSVLYKFCRIKKLSQYVQNSFFHVIRISKRTFFATWSSYGLLSKVYTKLVDILRWSHQSKNRAWLALQKLWGCMIFIPILAEFLLNGEDFSRSYQPSPDTALLASSSSLQCNYCECNMDIIVWWFVCLKVMSKFNIILKDGT